MGVCVCALHLVVLSHTTDVAWLQVHLLIAEFFYKFDHNKFLMRNNISSWKETMNGTVVVSEAQLVIGLE